MNLRIIVFRNDGIRKYMVWLEKMGMIETMFLLVAPDSIDHRSSHTPDSSILYLPKKESVWWKRQS